jgi:hypothetical protein
MATSKATSKEKVSEKVSPPETVTAEERFNMIAEAAYFCAERRGFQGGNPVEDWLAAEKEIDAKLAKQADAA